VRRAGPGLGASSQPTGRPQHPGSARGQLATWRRFCQRVSLVSAPTAFDAGNRGRSAGPPVAARSRGVVSRRLAAVGPRSPPRSRGRAVRAGAEHLPPPGLVALDACRGGRWPPPCGTPLPAPLAGHLGISGRQGHNGRRGACGAARAGGADQRLLAQQTGVEASPPMRSLRSGHPRLHGGRAM